MVVFIVTYFNTCYGRIKNDPNRPIAYNSTREQLSERFDYRRPLYLAHSHYVISGGYPPIVIASKIQKLYKRFDFGQGWFSSSLLARPSCPLFSGLSQTMRALSLCPFILHFSSYFCLWWCQKRKSFVIINSTACANSTKLFVFWIIKNSYL